MKKWLLRKLREESEKILGKEKTEEIINETVEKVLKETKPKKTIRKKNK